MESTINHEGPFCPETIVSVVVPCDSVAPSRCGLSYDLVETLCSTETSWSCTDDENVDVAVIEEFIVSPRIHRGPEQREYAGDLFIQGHEVHSHIRSCHPAL